MMIFDLRVSLPDRPGTLGALASALGEGGANIVSLEVVEREADRAVDDLSVEAPGGMQDALRIAAEQVPGLVIEDVRPADAFRDILAPIELAAKLAAQPGETIIAAMVEHLPEALGASWAAAIRRKPGGVEVIGRSIGAPSLAEMQTPWLPIAETRRLSESTWIPPRWRAQPPLDGLPGPEAAAAPLLGPDSAVLIARPQGPRFRSGELRQLRSLALIAAACSRRTGRLEREATGSLVNLS